MTALTEPTLYRVTYASAGCLPDGDSVNYYDSLEDAADAVADERAGICWIDADGYREDHSLSSGDVAAMFARFGMVGDPRPDSLYSWTLEPIGWDEPLPDGEDGEELADWFLDLDTGDAPGCAWGSSPARFHPVIVAACRAWCRAADEPMTFRHLDHWAGLVVNGHDDVAHALDNYATDEELDAIGYSRDDVRELHACCS